MGSDPVRLTCTRYSAQLFEYVALMMPSKSCMQNRIMMSVGTLRSQAYTNAASVRDTV
jgi:hypothetical protein